MTPRILVAGIGNVFFRDDGFGVEVAHRLAEAPPAGATVADFGIRAMHLAFALLDGVDLLIAIDATPRAGEPGTVYAIEPDLADLPVQEADAHGMSLGAVFANVKAMGGVLPRIQIVGCEPASVTEGMGLSPNVQASIGTAVDVVRELVARELANARWSAEPLARSSNAG